MELQISADGTMTLRAINPFFFALFQEIVQHAASNNPEVEERFFPSPVNDPQENSLAEDWKSLVHPELNANFRAARDVVQADLRLASKKKKEFSFKIPAKHADAWISALTQARLSLAEEHHFGEADLAAEVPQEISDIRSYALLQIHFYGFLQEWLVKLQDSPE